MARNRLLPYAPYLKQLARKLRKTATKAEVVLWERIRRKALEAEFHRQVPLGAYIVDFYCHELFLAIEIDGSSHRIDEVSQNDVVRQRALEALGVRLLRFDHAEVLLHTVEVVCNIHLAILALREDRDAAIG